MFRKIDYLPIVHALRFSSMHYHQCKVYASFLFPTNDVSRSMLRTEKLFCVAAAAAVSAGPFFLQFQFNKIFFLRLLQCKISLEAVLRQDILVPPFFSASFLEARKFCKCYNICKFSSSLQRKKEVTPYKSFPAARPHEILNNLNCN